MLTQELVLQKYLSFDYRIRYLAELVHPSTIAEPDAVFALENGLGHGLVCDPLSRPLLFDTEAEAFSYRHRLGLERPVLVFHEDESYVKGTEIEIGSLDASTLAAVDRYLGERP
ncbi:MAG: hypothetical protein ACLPXB_06690 [Thiobacillaceae bacterium]